MRRQTKSGSNGENKTNFGKFFTQSMNLDTYLTKISGKKSNLTKYCLKRGSFCEKLSKIDCELLKRGGHWVRASQKRGSMGESELKKGGQCVHAPPSPIFRECPLPLGQ